MGWEACRVVGKASQAGVDMGDLPQCITPPLNPSRIFSYLQVYYPTFKQRLSPRAEGASEISTETQVLPVKMHLVGRTPTRYY